MSRALTSLQRPYEQVQCCLTENVGGKWGCNYNTKTPDNELATVPCLHGYRSMTVGIALLAHKACAVR